MTDKTVIEKAKEDYKALVAYIENGMPLPPEDDPYWRASSALDSLGGFIAAIEEGKPANDNDAYDVALEILSLGNSKATPANISDKIQQFAESYHASRCKEESAAILAASDRLGAALDESDKV